MSPLRSMLPLSIGCVLTLCATVSLNANDYVRLPQNPIGRALLRQSAADALAKSRGCISCHEGVTGMHKTGTVRLGCVDCHGGDAQAFDKQHAHIQPCYPQAWHSSANPVRSYTLLNRESPEFIQFVNPGDLRVAHRACGVCHEQETHAVKKSMMTHGCMLWGAALYNNGGVPTKYPVFGEVTAPKAIRSESTPCPSRHRRSCATNSYCHFCNHFPGSRRLSPRIYCGFLKGEAAFAVRAEFPNAWKNQGDRGNA